MTRRALFISGAPGDTRRYRADHPAEALTLLGWGVRVLALEQAGVWQLAEIGEGETMILHRVAWSREVEKAIEGARRRGCTVLFDTDDLIFAPAAEERLAALREIQAAARRGPQFGHGSESGHRSESGHGPQFGHGSESGHGSEPGPEARTDAGSGTGQTDLDPATLGFARPELYLQTLLACDGCLAASAPIAEAVIALGRPAEVVANAIDLELLRLSTRARARAAAVRLGRDRSGAAGAPAGFDGRDDRIIIGYASGTATHDKDLEAALPALRSLLAKDPRVVFRLMGHVAPDIGLSEFGDRVQFVPFMAWRRLPAALSELDIAIAPLEADDEFARAKSELKFMEAGAVGVPIVATPIPAFRSAIRDGTDGMLASTDAEWESRLGALVNDASLRNSMGAAARAAVLDGWVTDTRAAELAAAIDRLSRGGESGPGSLTPMPRLVTSSPTDLCLSSEPEMARVVEALFEVSRDSDAAQGKGGPDSYSATAEAGSDSDVAHADLGSVSDGAPPFRVALGVRDALNRTADLLLLDGEPTIGRHAMGSELVLAQRVLSGLAGHPHSIESGRAPLTTLGIGPWLAPWLAQVHGTPMLPGLPFPLDTRIYVPGVGAADRDPVVALEVNGAAHLPDSALGLAALGRVAMLVPEAELVVFAEHPIEGLDALSGAVEMVGARWAGRLDSLARAELLRRAAAVIVPSCAATPPIALQAMACGCAVVAPDVGATRWLYIDGQTAFTAPPRADTLALAAAAVLRDVVMRARISDGAAVMVERMSTGRAAAALAAHIGSAVAASRGGEQFAGEEIMRAEVARSEVAGSEIMGTKFARASSTGAEIAGALNTGALILDRLQAHSDEQVGPRLASGTTAGQSFTSRFDGLTRFDVRLRRSPNESGRLRLTLRAHSDAAETVAMAEHPGPFMSGRWLPFEFGPLTGSAGRAYFAELAWEPDRPSVQDLDAHFAPPDDTAPELESLAVDAFADGRSFLGGQVDPSLTLAFRTWCRRPTPEPVIGGRAIDSELADALQLAARREIAVQRDVSLLESGWPFRLAAWLSPSPPPLPPLDQRPWPPEAPALKKLSGILRNYGPAALLTEIVSFRRWQGLSEQERAAAKGSHRRDRVGGA